MFLYYHSFVFVSSNPTNYIVFFVDKIKNVQDMEGQRTFFVLFLLTRKNMKRVFFENEVMRQGTIGNGGTNRKRRIDFFGNLVYNFLAFFTK